MPITAQQELQLRSYLTASMLPAALGLYPKPGDGKWLWCPTPYDAWLFYRYGTRKPETRPMWLGKKMESSLGQATAEVLGKRILRSNHFRVGRNGVQAAHLDFLLHGKKEALEVKLSGDLEGWGQQGTDEVPIWVLAQVMQQIYCAELDRAYVGALLGGHRIDLKVYEIPRDDELIRLLKDQAEEWWAKHVQEGKEPEGSEPHLEVLKLIRPVPEKKVQVSFHVWEAWCLAKEVARGAATLKDEKERDLRKLMPDVSLGILSEEAGDREITNTPQTRTSYGKDASRYSDICEHCGIGSRVSEFNVLRSRKARHGQTASLGAKVADQDVSGEGADPPDEAGPGGGKRGASAVPVQLPD